MTSTVPAEETATDAERSGTGPRATFVALAFTLAAGAGSSWLGLLDRPQLWTDEEFSLRFSASYATIGDDFHPPTYYALLRTWFNVVPDTLAWARALSAGAFLGAVVTWAVLGRRWWRESRVPGTAILAMVVLSLLSPHALLFGRMARYFGLVSLALALALVSWWAVLGRVGRPGRTLPGLTVAAHIAVGLMSYPTFAVLVAAETMTVLLRRRRDLRRHGALAAVAVVLWLVLVATLPTDASTLGGDDDVNRPLMALVATTLPLWSATIGETVSPLDPVASIPAVLAWGVLGAASIAALRSRAQRRQDEGAGVPDWRQRFTGWMPADPAVLLALLLVAGTLAALVVVTFTVDLAHTGLQASKYFVPVAPAFYLLIGLGVDRLARHGRRPLVAVAVLAAVGTGWAIGTVNLFRGRDYLYPSYALPWDEVAATVAEVVADDRSHAVAVLVTDRAFGRILVDDGVAADIVDASVHGGQLVHDGVDEGVIGYDTMVFVERQRLNRSLELGIVGARSTALEVGFREVARETFGHVDDGLRRLQELAAGRDLDAYLVEVTVVRR